MKVCEMCESDNYCKHCGTCHDCLSESIDNADKQLAAANEEIAALKTYASKGDEEIKSLDEQLDAYEKAISWHVNHTNKMHKEIAELSPLVEIASNQKQRIQQMEEQLAAAKAEIADMDRVFERANNANQRLLTKAYGEIAEYREALECLIIEHGIHDSYDGGLLPDNEQSLTIQAAIKLLAKHKESE